MESFNPETVCPKCGHRKLKTWNDLSEDEKMIARRVPNAEDFSIKDFKSMTFCVRCWDITFQLEATLA